MMDAAYLKSTVGPALVNAIAASSMLNFNNSLSSNEAIKRATGERLAAIAEHLRWQVLQQQPNQLQQQINTQPNQKNGNIEVNDLDQKEYNKSNEKPSSTRMLDEPIRASQDNDRNGAFETALKTAQTIEELFNTFIIHFEAITKVPAIYMVRIQPAMTTANAGNVVNSAIEEACYVAANEANKFLIERRLKRDEGVLWELFGELNEQSDDMDEEETKSNLDVQPRSLFVSNVLSGEHAQKIKFFRRPALGSFLAVRVTYDSLLNDASLDDSIDKESDIIAAREAEAEERRQAEEAERQAALDAQQTDEDDEEEQDEAPSRRTFSRSNSSNEAVRVPQGMVKGAVSSSASEPVVDPVRMDELEAQQEIERAAVEEALLEHTRKQQNSFAICIDTVGSSTRLAVTKVDTAIHWAKQLIVALIRIDRALFLKERLRRKDLLDFNRNFDEITEEDRTEAIELLIEKLESEKQPHTEEDAIFAFHKSELLRYRPQLLGLQEHLVLRGSIVPFVLLFDLLGYDASLIRDSTGVPDWHRIRPHLNDSFADRVAAYNPRASTATIHEFNVWSQTLSSVDSDEIREQNRLLDLVVQYISAAIAVKERQVAEEQAAKEAAEEAAAAEEERRRQEQEEADAAEGELSENEADDE